LSANGDENADFTGLTELPAVEVTAKPGSISKENDKLKLVVEFSNPSSTIAFALNPKLLSFSTKEPILPIFWQDNYFTHAGETYHRNAGGGSGLVTEGRLLFKLEAGT
jgi:hypothetical protein